MGAVELPDEIVPALRSAATVERTVAMAAFAAAAGPGILAIACTVSNCGIRNRWPSAETA